jgi:hypothetical protein
VLKNELATLKRDFEERLAGDSSTAAYDALYAIGIELIDRETPTSPGDQIRRELGV